jgi:hypothetical protein
MAEPTKNRKEWRMSRRCAGVARRSYMLGRTPIKRLRFLMNEGYGTYSMGLCYRRRLKLRLGGRKVRVANYIIVVVKER